MKPQFDFSGWPEGETLNKDGSPISGVTYHLSTDGYFFNYLPNQNGGWDCQLFSESSGGDRIDKVVFAKGRLTAENHHHIINRFESFIAVNLKQTTMSTDKTIPLVVIDGYAQFLLEFTPNQDFYNRAEFRVFRVSEWSSFSGKEALEKEIYVSGYILWDGDIIIRFGDENGEVYINGEYGLNHHKKVLDEIWEACKGVIEEWNSDIAEC